ALRRHARGGLGDDRDHGAVDGAGHDVLTCGVGRCAALCAVCAPRAGENSRSTSGDELWHIQGSRFRLVRADYPHVTPQGGEPGTRLVRRSAVLLSFRVANHRSIREETELSLVATELNESTARETGARSEGKSVSVLPAVGIFGANASGKSNVLHGLRFMRTAVLDSFADWGRKPGVPREPFALDPEAREETSFFEVDLLLGKQRVRYTYGFELSDERVEAGWLHAYPSGRRQEWFDREADRPQAEGGAFSFPG